MLQEYQDRMEMLGNQLERFSDEFVEQHPELAHQLEDTRVHLQKAQQEVADSLSEWGAVGELKANQLAEAMDAKLLEFERLLKTAIAKF